MNFLLVHHLILKEVRYQRTRLVLIWLMAYLLPFSNFFQDQYFYNLADTFKTVLIVIFAITILLIWVSSIFLDPTFGPDRFLATRPVHWTTLLTSKTLFVLLFLWMPLIIFRLLIAWTVGVRLSFLNQAIYLFESTLFFFAAASLIVVPALFFRRLTTLLLFIAGFVFSSYLLLLLGGVVWETFNLDAIFIPTRSYGAYDPDPQLDLSLMVSDFMVACVIIATTMIPVALLRFRKPSVAIPFTVAFAGFFLALVYGTTWPYPFDQLASDAPAEPGELPSSLRNQLHFSLENSTWNTSRNTDYSKKILESDLVQKMHLEGIARPLFLIGQGSMVKGSFASGRKLPTVGTYAYNAHPHYEWLADYLREVCSGISPSNPLYENLDMTQTFRFQGRTDKPNGHDILDEELPAATISGQSDFGVFQLKVLNMLPFRPGARQDMRRHCLEIRQLVSSEKSIDVLLNTSTIPLVLRGDLKYPEYSTYSTTHNTPFVVINRKTGEILDSKNESDYYNPLDGLTLQRWTFTRPKPKGSPITEPPPSFPRNWLDDAYICFFDVEPLGKVSFPFSATVNNVISVSPEKPN